MEEAARPAANKFVSAVRKIYNPIGFSHSYNFVLFFIFGGALFGFSLSQIRDLNFDGFLCSTTVPGGAGGGECFWFRQRRYRIGIMMHLSAILPASMLVVLQFIPIIRYKAILFHRINGYIMITLLLLSNAGILIIARRSFGGLISTQTAIGWIVLATTFAVSKAYISIKRLEIHKHRMWMLRAWVWGASTITLRLILLAIFRIVPGADGNTSFSASIWLAQAVHVACLEVYLHYTQGETERLRKVSIDRRAQRKSGQSDQEQLGGMRDSDQEELKD